MSAATIDYDALAAQHGGTVQVDYDALAAQHGGTAVSGGAGGVDLSNKAGQGTYNMWDDAGHKLAVPYDQVPVALGKLYQFDTNADQGGQRPMDRFYRDLTADPNLVGPKATSSPGQFMAPAHTPANAAAKVQAEQNQGAGHNLAEGVAKGAGTITAPIEHGMALAGFAPPADEYNAQLTANTPMQDVGKFGTMAAAVAPAAIAAPVATALGLGGGAAAGYAGQKAATALGAGPNVSAVVGDAAGLAGGVAAGAGLPRLMPEAVRNGTLPSAWDWVANKPKELLAGDVNAPIPGTDVTPASRYEAMQRVGVQPNAAEATNSTPLNMAERVNQNSLTAQSTYVRARAANLAALNRFANRVLDTMSPQSPEEGGAAVQQGLLKAHADMKEAATAAYRDLDDQVGDQPLPGAAGLRQQAQAILDANAPYYKLHPELEPTKAMAIVRDLADAKAPVKSGPAVIPGFGPEPPAPEVAPPRELTYSELHRLRSDLLDFNNTNPDLVKNQANGWISQLAGAADKAITSGEGALTPEQLGTFRNANEAWKFMKDSFDNPSHPFYQAVRNPSPSTLVSGTSGIARTPEMVDTLKGVLGPEGIGPVQRGVAENLLKTTKEGGFNFKTFQGLWNKLKPGYRDALFTPEQQQQLEDIGNAGTVMHEDANPSGTAKLGQGQAEMLEGSGAIGAAATGHPLSLAGTAAYHATQYALGKLMNSPTFVDWLMKDQGAPSAAPGSFGDAARIWKSGALPVDPAGARSDPHTGPDGQPNFYSDEYLRAKGAFDAARKDQ
jgi:hypothetical protein